MSRVMRESIEDKIGRRKAGREEGWFKLHEFLYEALNIWVKLKNKKGMMTLLGVYLRTPNSLWESEEQRCQEIACSCRSNKVIVVGYFPLTGRGKWMKCFWISF